MEVNKFIAAVFIFLVETRVANLETVKIKLGGKEVIIPLRGPVHVTRLEGGNLSNLRLPVPNLAEIISQSRNSPQQPPPPPRLPTPPDRWGTNQIYQQQQNPQFYQPQPYVPNPQHQPPINYYPNNNLQHLPPNQVYPRPQPIYDPGQTLPQQNGPPPYSTHPSYSAPVPPQQNPLIQNNYDPLPQKQEEQDTLKHAEGSPEVHEIHEPIPHDQDQLSTPKPREHLIPYIPNDRYLHHKHTLPHYQQKPLSQDQPHPSPLHEEYDPSPHNRQEQHPLLLDKTHILLAHKQHDPFSHDQQQSSTHEQHDRLPFYQRPQIHKENQTLLGTDPKPISHKENPIVLHKQQEHFDSIIPLPDKHSNSYPSTDSYTTEEDSSLPQTTPPLVIDEITFINDSTAPVQSNLNSDSTNVPITSTFEQSVTTNPSVPITTTTTEMAMASTTSASLPETTTDHVLETLTTIQPYIIIDRWNVHDETLETTVTSLLKQSETIVSSITDKSTTTKSSPKENILTSASILMEPIIQVTTEVPFTFAPENATSTKISVLSFTTKGADVQKSVMEELITVPEQYSEIETSTVHTTTESTIKDTITDIILTTPNEYTTIDTSLLNVTPVNVFMQKITTSPMIDETTESTAPDVPVTSDTVQDTIIDTSLLNKTAIIPSLQDTTRYITTTLPGMDDTTEIFVKVTKTDVPVTLLFEQDTSLVSNAVTESVEGQKVAGVSETSIDQNTVIDTSILKETTANVFVQDPTTDVTTESVMKEIKPDLPVTLSSEQDTSTVNNAITEIIQKQEVTDVPVTSTVQDTAINTSTLKETMVNAFDQDTITDVTTESPKIDTTKKIVLKETNAFVQDTTTESLEIDATKESVINETNPDVLVTSTDQDTVIDTSTHNETTSKALVQETNTNVITRSPIVEYDNSDSSSTSTLNAVSEVDVKEITTASSAIKQNLTMISTTTSSTLPPITAPLISQPQNTTNLISVGSTVKPTRRRPCKKHGKKGGRRKGHVRRRKRRSTTVAPSTVLSRSKRAVAASLIASKLSLTPFKVSSRGSMAKLTPSKVSWKG